MVEILSDEVMGLKTFSRDTTTQEVSVSYINLKFSMVSKTVAED